MLEHDRDEDVCLEWDDLAEQDHTYRMSEAEYIHNRQNWWISLNKSKNDDQPVRKRSDFNQALSTLNRSHQKAGGQQLRPMPYRKYKEWKPASSSSSTWWQMERILVGFRRIHRKSTKRGCKQRFAIERAQTVVYKTLAKTSDERLSRIHSILLQIDRLQLTAVYCNRR